VEKFTGAVGEDRLVQAIEDLLQISR
jgi:hypothetical protein